MADAAVGLWLLVGYWVVGWRLAGHAWGKSQQAVESEERHKPSVVVYLSDALLPSSCSTRTLELSQRNGADEAGSSICNRAGCSEVLVPRFQDVKVSPWQRAKWMLLRVELRNQANGVHSLWYPTVSDYCVTLAQRLGTLQDGNVAHGISQRRGTLWYRSWAGKSPSPIGK